MFGRKRTRLKGRTFAERMEDGNRQMDELDRGQAEGKGRSEASTGPTALEIVQANLMMRSGLGLYVHFYRPPGTNGRML